MNEVVDGSVTAVIDELVDEFLGAHIQYDPVCVELFYFVTDGLASAFCPNQRRRKNNQRVERGGAWFSATVFPARRATRLQSPSTNASKV